MNTQLTEKQEAVLAFMVAYSEEKGLPPTTREIQRNFDLASQTSAVKYLRSLEKKGLVEQNGDGRSWTPKHREVQGFLFSVPLYGTIPAGLAADNPASSDEAVRIDPATYGLRSARGLFALKVRGDSMTGAQIADGDIALLRDQPAQIGDIVAALIDGESSLKRLARERGRTVLRAENPRYRDLVPAESLRPQGVLVGIVGRGKR